jgi:hypothetical protein
LVLQPSSRYPSYDPKEDALEAIALWQDGAWAMMRDTKLKAPVTLVAIPTIGGLTGVEFTCDDFESDRAQRVGAAT